MQKRMNLAAQDCKNDMIKIINNSGLPITLIKYILQDLITEATAIEQNVIQEEIKDYENGLHEKERIQKEADKQENKNSKGENK